MPASGLKDSSGSIGWVRDWLLSLPYTRQGEVACYHGSILAATLACTKTELDPMCSQTAAASQCRTEGGYLASFESAAHLQWLFNLAQAGNPGSAAWVGASDAAQEG